MILSENLFEKAVNEKIIKEDISGQENCSIIPAMILADFHRKQGDLKKITHFSKSISSSVNVSEKQKSIIILI
jgi:hypothetical protein